MLPTHWRGSCASASVPWRVYLVFSVVVLYHTGGLELKRGRLKLKNRDFRKQIPKSDLEGAACRRSLRLLLMERRV